MAETGQPNGPPFPSIALEVNEAPPHPRSQAAEAETVPQTPTPECYPDRYLESDYVILSLGSKPSLFRVPREILAKYSGVFRDLFSLPLPECGTSEGSSDDNPIRLLDDPDHFAGILSVYYGTVLMPHPCDLSFEYVTGVLHVAFKYEFALAIEWAWSNLSATWSWRALPWLTALSQPSPNDLAQSIALINISRELDDHRLLGSALYMLCVDYTWRGEESIYGAMQPSDVFLLLKCTRKLSHLWVERCTTQVLDGYPVRWFESSSLDWLAFVRDLSTIAAIHRDMGFPFP